MVLMCLIETSHRLHTHAVHQNPPWDIVCCVPTHYRVLLTWKVINVLARAVGADLIPHIIYLYMTGDPQLRV